MHKLDSLAVPSARPGLRASNLLASTPIHNADAAFDAGDDALVPGILARVSQEVGPERFHRYFDRQTRLELHDGTLDVTVPSGFLADYLGRRFGDSLRRAAHETTHRDVQLRFRVDQDAFESASSAGSTTAHGRPTPASAAPSVKTAEPIRPRAPRPSAPAHDLSTFLVGESNKLAHSAVRRLVDAADASLSHVFIHGQCGIGKTHLLAGALNTFRNAKPGAIVRYVTAEVFTGEYVQSIRHDTVPAFRRQYRDVDLLCIDDVHILAGKESTQRELLHTFDVIGLAGARVLLASDCHPREIRSLSQHLLSRFVAGAVVAIQAPDAELTRRLIQHFAARRGLMLESAATQALAEHASSRRFAVREIEGLLMQIDAAWRVMPELAPLGAIGLTLVRKALGLSEAPRSLSSRPRRPIPAQAIITEVCRTLAVDHHELVGKGRHKRVVFARELIVCLCRKLTTMSFPEIAHAMGRPNHSTVLTAHKRFQTNITNQQLAAADLPEHMAQRPLKDIVDNLAREIERTHS